MIDGNPGESDLRLIRKRMRQFTQDRDWERFHDPKSLTLALVGEVGELAELLQWLPADEVIRRVSDEPLRTRVGEELSDVLIYLVRLADVMGIDLGAAASRKIDAAERRFSVGEFHGNAPVKE